MRKISTRKCKTCGKIFEKKINCSVKEWSKSQYCSRQCINVGRVSPFKGMTNRWSDEWRQIMSEHNMGIRSNTGRTHIKKGQHLSPSTEFGKVPPWNKGKSNPYFAGPNNPNWKGGIYPEHLKIRHSVEMKRWRLKVFERDNYTCVLCSRKRKSGDRVILHADHYPKTFAFLLKEFKLDTFEKAKEFKKFWDIKLGRTLCRECHLKTDTHGVNL